MSQAMLDRAIAWGDDPIHAGAGYTLAITFNHGWQLEVRIPPKSYQRPLAPYFVCFRLEDTAMRSPLFIKLDSISMVGVEW